MSVSYLHITATSYIYLNSLALPHTSRFSISYDEHVPGKVVKYKNQCSQWLTTDNTEESPAVCISCGLSLQAVHTIVAKVGSRFMKHVGKQTKE